MVLATTPVKRLLAVQNTVDIEDALADSVDHILGDGDGVCLWHVAHWHATCPSRLDVDVVVSDSDLLDQLCVAESVQFCATDQIGWVVNRALAPRPSSSVSASFS